MICFIIVEVRNYHSDKEEVKDIINNQNNTVDIIENNMGCIMYRNMSYVHIQSQEHLKTTLIKSVLFNHSYIT